MHEVQLAGLVLAEGARIERRVERFGRDPCRANGAYTPDATAAKVGVDVLALKIGIQRPSVDVAASDRALLARDMRVFEDRVGAVGRRTSRRRLVAVSAFAIPP